MPIAPAADLSLAGTSGPSADGGDTGLGTIESHFAEYGGRDHRAQPELGAFRRSKGHGDAACIHKVKRVGRIALTEDNVARLVAAGRRAGGSGARIVRFPFSRGGRLGAEETFAEVPYGMPDGFAFDADGTLILCSVRMDGDPAEIQRYDRDGRLIDRQRPGGSNLYTNLALAADGTAYVTDTEHGEMVALDGFAASALPLHPFRSA